MSNADNVARWSANIRQVVVGRFKSVAASVSAEFADEAQTEIALLMPVKTGHAVANVQVSYFGAATNEIPAVDPGRQSTIAFNSAKIANAQPNQNIHISLTVPYGQRLENGWSRQAPNGVFRVVLERLRANAKAIGARGAQRALGSNR